MKSRSYFWIATNCDGIKVKKRIKAGSIEIIPYRIVSFYRICYVEMLISIQITARPRDTRILVPEKNRAAQNRAS